jgi:hypothetical protein
VKTFARILLSGWALLFATVLLIFIFPKPASRLLHGFAPYIQIVPLLLLIGSAIYGLTRIYRAGMKHLTRS